MHVHAAAMPQFESRCYKRAVGEAVGTAEETHKHNKQPHTLSHAIPGPQAFVAFVGRGVFCDVGACVCKYLRMSSASYLCRPRSFPAALLQSSACAVAPELPWLQVITTQRCTEEPRGCCALCAGIGGLLVLRAPGHAGCGLGVFW